MKIKNGIKVTSTGSMRNWVTITEKNSRTVDFILLIVSRSSKRNSVFALLRLTRFEIIQSAMEPRTACLVV